ncbi:MAG: hypothetical protein GSR77_00285 [Desulfurococcales archaeon]|nr:hypothetical protein [Desulfurococcales archaeon]
MAWQGLEPWQAIIAGLFLGFIVAALVNRVLVGYWNFLRAPRTGYYYVRWLIGLIAGWIALYYSTLLLVRDELPEECHRDVWGPWFYVFIAVSAGVILVIYKLHAVNVDKVDWCAHCREQRSR